MAALCRQGDINLAYVKMVMIHAERGPGVSSVAYKSNLIGYPPIPHVRASLLSPGFLPALVFLPLSVLYVSNVVSRRDWVFTLHFILRRHLISRT